MFSRFCLLLALTNVAVAQTTTLPDAAAPMTPPDKAYVMTDRPQYVAGDTLWFKAYVVDGQRHTANTASHTLHVALLDASGQAVQRQTLYLDSLAQGAGQLALPNALPTGTYQLLAYTPRMQLDGPDALFRLPVRVLGASASSADQPGASADAPVTARVAGNVATGSSPAQRYVLRLLPEGGQLVTGLTSRVAFQATDALDRSVAVRGVIVSSRGDTLTEFQSIHRGRGTFNLTPQPGQRYRAVATINGQPITADLPATLPQGYVLAVDNLTSEETINVVVQNSQPRAGQLTLMAYTRDLPSFSTKLPADRAEVRVGIPRRAVAHEGVMRLTLLDGGNRPVAERLAFISLQEPLQLALTPDRVTYQPRQPVEVKVKVADAEGQPVATQVAVAVTDAGQNPTTSAATLRSYLMLTSDLRGHIESPDDYLDTTDRRTALWTDLLMLTHGWRKITATPAPVEAGLSWRGQVIQSVTGQPLANESLNLMLKTGTRLMPLTAKTHQNGWFQLDGLRFADTATLVVRSRYNRPLRVLMDPVLTPLPAFRYVPDPQGMGNAEADRALVSKAADTQAFFKLLREKGTITLNEVGVKARRTSINKDDPRRILYGKADHVVVANDQLRSMRSIGHMIAGQVPGVQVEYSEFGDVVITTMSSARISGRQTVAVMLDGVLIDRENIRSISPNDVDEIDFIMNPATAGALNVGTGGQAINILTRRGSDKTSLNSGYATIQGYAVAREFYSPRYATTDPPATRPDRRATVYWNPAVQTDANGEATLRFFNTDELTTIRIIAEGLTADGQPILGRGRYVVGAVSER